MTDETHRRHRPDHERPGSEASHGEFRFEESRKPGKPAEEWGPGPEPEIRPDRRHHVEKVPGGLVPDSEVDVFRDANVGPVPVEPRRAPAPRSTPVDSGQGYAFGPEPHRAERPTVDRPAHPVRVMTTGVFDLIHLGHIQMLDAAKRLGSELVVVIARDETVRQQKHNPINDEETRRKIVAALKPVDRAVLGRHGDIYQIVKEIHPSVIALGFDQAFREDVVKQRCADVGVPVEVVRLPQFDFDLDATRKIVERIGERIQRNELYTHEEGT